MSLNDFRLERMERFRVEFWDASDEKQRSMMRELATDTMVLHRRPSDYLKPVGLQSMGDVVAPVQCEFCRFVAKNQVSLKSHLGKVHQDKKEIWGKKNF